MREISINAAEFKALAGDLLSRDKLIKFKASGFSMSPFIKNGDILEVQPNATSSIQIGDIILYSKMSDILIAHRVVSIDEYQGERRFITQGDSLFTPDDGVSSNQVLGQVMAVERSGRRIILNSTSGRIFVNMWLFVVPIIRRFRQLYSRLSS